MKKKDRRITRNITKHTESLFGRVAWIWNYVRNANMSQRIKICVFFMVAFWCIIVVKVSVYQIYYHSKMETMAQGQAEQERKIQSPRGTIMDRDGRVLAISEMAKSLYADPAMIQKAHANDPSKPSPDEVAHLLAPYLKLKEPELAKVLNEDTGFVWLEHTMEHDTYLAVNDIIKSNKLEGLVFQDENHRYYPNGKMAAQLIGFVGADDRGLTGIEMILDSEIKGDLEELKITTDKQNISILGSVLEKVLPHKERSVRLTIDSSIQYIAERGLDGIMKRNKPSGAAIIIMDPKTGEILAMASRPNFDPNEFGKGSDEAYKNRAVNNIYEPGSTFKPIMASAALDSGKWDINRVYHDTGSIEIGDRTIYNWDKVGLGNVTIRDMLKYSINTAMSYLGMTIGKETEIAYAHKFGFGQPTGIELPGEASGMLFDVNTMTPIDEATMAIGQGNAVTPLQMVQAFGAIANGGHMMKPYVIKEIDNPDGSVYKQFNATEVGQPISEEVSKTITDILADEVSTGGGQNAKIDGYRFCGKTGTAQRLDPDNGGYAEGQYIGSFVGFGPAEDPQYVVLIVVDNPSGVYYGAQVAAPVFKEIMTEIVRIKGISPTERRSSVPTDAKKDTTTPRHEIPEVRRSEEGILIPSFMGWTNREVNDWLTKAGLGFIPTGTGRGVYQEPRAGMYVPENSDVHVTFVR